MNVTVNILRRYVAATALTVSGSALLVSVLAPTYSQVQVLQQYLLPVLDSLTCGAIIGYEMRHSRYSWLYGASAVLLLDLLIYLIVLLAPVTHVISKHPDASAKLVSFGNLVLHPFFSDLSRGYLSTPLLISMTVGALGAWLAGSIFEITVRRKS